MPIRPLRSPWRLFLLAGAVATLVGVGPCADHGDPYSPFAATSPAEAITRLSVAYFQLNADHIDQLLAEDFVFELSDLDADSLGIDAEWDRETEMRLTRNMFSGQDGRRVDGSRQPGLFIGFAFNNVQLIATPGPMWTRVNSGPLAGTYKQEYHASFTAQFTEEDSDQIRGLNRFWVREESTTGRYGQPVSRYRIVRWEDDGFILFSKHQVIGWGRLKAKFEDPPPTPPPVSQ